MSHTDTVRGTLIRSEVSAQSEQWYSSHRVVRSQNEDSALTRERGEHEAEGDQAGREAVHSTCRLVGMRNGVTGGLRVRM